MREICLHIPANACEAHLFELSRDAAGAAVETPLCDPHPIDATLFQAGAALDPRSMAGLFAANLESPEFFARGVQLLDALGMGAILFDFLTQNANDVRVYVRVEHPLLRDISWELLSQGVNPLFSIAPWTRVLRWPLPPAAN